MLRVIKQKSPGLEQMTNFPKISLCMIARDEEEFIGQCIRSVQSIVSEIILVDTGSNDATVEIAHSLGATIFHRPWDDDFSAPRNLSLRKATGDWILVLDADEAIAATDLDKIRQHTLTDNSAYELLQRHYSNDHRVSLFHPCKNEYPDWERHYSGYFTSNLCRLFPNHMGFEFRNRLHELVEPSIHENEIFTIYQSPVPIHHYGHTPEVKARKQKSKIYTPLGAQKVQEDPLNWKNHFEMAVELNVNNRRMESAYAFRMAAALNPTYTQTWINLGYVLNELKAYQSAIDVLNRALSLEPEHPEAHCNIAVTYMRLERYIFAKSHLEKAIILRPDYTNALCNLGQVHVARGELDLAEKCYRRAIALTPQNVTALSELGSVLSKQGKHEAAIHILNDAVALDQAFPRSYYHLGYAYRSNNDTQAAIDALEILCTLLTKSNGNEKIIAKIQATCTEWSNESQLETSKSI
jgi:tetratricopeptide (TPR) repeat protein